MTGLLTRLILLAFALGLGLHFRSTGMALGLERMQAFRESIQVAVQP